MVAPVVVNSIDSAGLPQPVSPTDPMPVAGNGAVPTDAQPGEPGLPTTAQMMAFNGIDWDRLACNALGGINPTGLLGTPVVNALIGVLSGSNHVALSGIGLGADKSIGGTGMVVMAIPAYMSPPTGKFVRQRNLDTFHTGKCTAAGSSVIWTPAAGTSFRLMRIQVDVTSGVTAAAAGDLDIVCYDGATAMPIALSAYIPAAVTGNSWSSGWIELGNGILSAAADNTLSINLSFALTAGVVRVTVAGTEE